MEAEGHREVGDLYDLTRFVQAQETVYARALGELRRGRKESHWMWYVFPQFDGLGSSATSRLYSIKSTAEAEAYLADPVLGSRLVECAEALLALQGRSAHEILGAPDDLKLRSCATLFAAVSPPGSVFTRLLEKYFRGEPDPKTLELIGAERRAAGASTSGYGLPRPWRDPAAAGSAVPSRDRSDPSASRSSTLHASRSPPAPPSPHASATHAPRGTMAM